MEFTPLAFLAAAERMLATLLPTEPPGGAQWNFQRLVNFASQSGSLEIGIRHGAQAAVALGVLQVRITPDSQKSLLQGWLQMGDAGLPAAFTLEAAAGPRAEEEIFALAEGWAAEIVRAIPTPEPVVKKEEGEKKSAPAKSRPAKARA